MYEMNLKESLFPEQSDADLWDIPVGELLRDIAATYPCSEAVVEVDENGDRALCLTYQEVLDTSERLAVALGTRFVKGEKIVICLGPQHFAMDYFGICLRLGRPCCGDCKPLISRTRTTLCARAVGRDRSISS